MDKILEEDRKEKYRDFTHALGMVILLWVFLLFVIVMTTRNIAIILVSMLFITIILVAILFISSPLPPGRDLTDKISGNYQKNN